MRIGWCVLALTAFAARAAHADRNDFTLERMIGPPQTPGVPNDPAGNIPLQSAYRSLMSEMGVVLSPKFLAPADTLGWSGFNFSFDTTFTKITDRADYWQRGVRNVSSGFLPTVTATARKGLWAPLPAFELGGGLSYLVDSSIYALQAYAKLGLHEGFHGWPLPSVALRAAVSRPMGTSQVDMTIVSTDLSLSKSFGVAGALRLEPYLAANLLVNIVSSQVIDTTPGIDAFRQGGAGPDLNANTTFPNQGSILRWRLFAGLRLVYSYLVIAAEVAYTFCNDSAMDCRRDDPIRVTDRSDGQLQLSFSAGMTF